MTNILQTLAYSEPDAPWPISTKFDIRARNRRLQNNPADMQTRDINEIYRPGGPGHEALEHDVVWKVYNDESAKADTALSEASHRSIDILLIFVSQLLLFPFIPLFLIDQFRRAYLPLSWRHSSYSYIKSSYKVFHNLLVPSSHPAQHYPWNNFNESTFYGSRRSPSLSATPRFACSASNGYNLQIGIVMEAPLDSGLDNASADICR